MRCQYHSLNHSPVHRRTLALSCMCRFSRRRFAAPSVDGTPSTRLSLPLTYRDPQANLSIPCVPGTCTRGRAVILVPAIAVADLHHPVDDTRQCPIGIGGRPVASALLPFAARAGSAFPGSRTAETGRRTMAALQSRRAAALGFRANRMRVSRRGRARGGVVSRFHPESALDVAPSTRVRAAAITRATLGFGDWYANGGTGVRSVRRLQRRRSRGQSHGQHCVAEIVA